jgi:putative SOS response-associated peptidase YedK
MCGRFTRNYTWAQIHAMYSIVPVGGIPNLRPDYNVCPTDNIDAIVPEFANRKLVPMRWGLVPIWWKKPLKELPATFNARAETIAEKPMFRDAFKRFRCLIPDTGYYEWKATPEGKQPYYFTRRDGEVMTFAGMYSTWTDPKSKEVIQSCCMVITEANKFVAEIHDRMPVILEAKDFDAWSRGPDSRAAADLMRPAADDLLEMRRVSKRVNSSKADKDDASLIEPL